MKSRVIIFIPARRNSKSIPMKNIKYFCGKPLIDWTLDELILSKEIDDIIVATDSDEIAKHILKKYFKKVKLYDRDEENSRDDSTTESVMMEYLRKNKYNLNDIFILVQCTNPFLRVENIDEAIKDYKKNLKKNKNYSILSVTKFFRFIWKNIGNKKRYVSLNYNYFDRKRRQNIDEDTYIENGSFYINTVDNILRYRNRLSSEVGIYEMPEYSSLELDEISDWKIGESIMKSLQNKKIEKEKIKLFISDVDGTYLNGEIYYTMFGYEDIIKSNTKDNKAISLLKENNKIVALLTSTPHRKSLVQRSKNLNIDYVWEGIDNKLEFLQNKIKKIGINFDEIAYIGDDINDIELMKCIRDKGGIIACPNNANNKVKEIDEIYIMNQDGGYGALREFVDLILF